MTPFTTSLSALSLPPWAAFGAHRQITQCPLLDDRTGLAHLTYEQALDVASSHGARLPTRGEVLALHVLATHAGTELAPVILPGASPALLARGYKPGDPEMSSWEWCAIHDSAILPSIRRFAQEKGYYPVANAGKHWIGPCPKGLAMICGWWEGAGFVQQGLEPVHNDQYADYATTTLLVRDCT